MDLFIGSELKMEKLHNNYSITLLLMSKSYKWNIARN